MTDGNDRVTVAVLENQVSHLAERIDDKVGGLDEKIDHLIDKVDDGLEKNADVDKCIAVLISDYDNLDKKVDNMDDRYKKINIATSFGASVAFVLAALGIRQ